MPKVDHSAQFTERLGLGLGVLKEPLAPRVATQFTLGDKTKKAMCGNISNYSELSTFDIK